MPKAEENEQKPRVKFQQTTKNIYFLREAGITDFQHIAYCSSSYKKVSKIQSGQNACFGQLLYSLCLVKVCFQQKTPQAEVLC